LWFLWSKRLLNIGSSLNFRPFRTFWLDFRSRKNNIFFDVYFWPLKPLKTIVRNIFFYNILTGDDEKEPQQHLARQKTDMRKQLMMHQLLHDKGIKMHYLAHEKAIKMHYLLIFICNHCLLFTKKWSFCIQNTNFSILRPWKWCTVNYEVKLHTCACTSEKSLYYIAKKISAGQKWVDFHLWRGEVILTFISSSLFFRPWPPWQLRVLPCSWSRRTNVARRQSEWSQFEWWSNEITFQTQNLLFRYGIKKRLDIAAVPRDLIHGKKANFIAMKWSFGEALLCNLYFYWLTLHFTSLCRKVSVFGFDQENTLVEAMPRLRYILRAPKVGKIL